MARRTLMHNYARWHIWLGWLVAVPLLFWTVRASQDGTPGA